MLACHGLAGLSSAAGLSGATMQRLARATTLYETTLLLPPERGALVSLS